MKPDYFTLRLDGEDGRAIRREANRQGVSCAAVIRQLIEPKLAELVTRERKQQKESIL